MGRDVMGGVACGEGCDGRNYIFVTAHKMMRRKAENTYTFLFITHHLVPS